MDFDLDHVSVSYRMAGGISRPALKDFSLTISSGDSVGIVGREGAGKSTLLMVLDGLIDPETGVVRIDAKELRANSEDLPAIRSRIGFAFQFPEHRFLAATVHEEIRLSAGIGLHHDQEIRNVLVGAGLNPDHFLSRNPFTLSMGEARRLMIASLTMSQPECLLLDEPTAGLDGAGRKWIADTLIAERARGTTIVLVSHDLDLLAETATRIVAIERGSIVMDAGIASLVSRREELKDCGYDPAPVVEILDRLVLTGRIGEGTFLRPSDLRSLLRGDR